MLLRFFIITSLFLFSQCRGFGNHLWKYWVTAGKNLSIWDNSEQIAYEKKHPELPFNQTHPSVYETRWDVSHLIEGLEEAKFEWVVIEIGDKPMCGDECSQVLFGLETVNGFDVRLHSFNTKNEIFRSWLELIHSDPSSSPSLNISTFNRSNIDLVYKLRYNDTVTPKRFEFYGEGKENLDQGASLIIKETIYENTVAPLELFYDDKGNLLTTYVDPIVYKEVKREAMISRGTSSRV